MRKILCRWDGTPPRPDDLLVWCCEHIFTVPPALVRSGNFTCPRCGTRAKETA